MDPTAIAHLFRRAGFGLSPRGWATWRDRSVDQAVAMLFAAAEHPAPLDYLPPFAPIDRKERQRLSPAEREERQQRSRAQRNEIIADWIQRMGNDEIPALLKRACLFRLDHFACRIIDGPQAASYLNTLRKTPVSPGCR
jgi:hypothetical protein